jgi:hypothetical protein
MENRKKIRKLFLFLLLISFIETIQAQNIQFLRGSKDLNFVTFELYKPLEHGTLYYFTDFKFSKNGYYEAYSEISKYWNLTKTVSLTAQYNAGLNENFQIKPVYLGGISKAFKLGENFDLSIDGMYRYQKELILSDEKQNGYQITINFCQNLDKIQISGYYDFWNSKYYIFEPQAWYKLFKRIYLGLEWRKSNYDLLENYENYFMFGFKWNLE